MMWEGAARGTGPGQNPYDGEGANCQIQRRVLP